jgi:hypothetical protein
MDFVEGIAGRCTVMISEALLRETVRRWCIWLRLAEKNKAGRMGSGVKLLLSLTTRRPLHRKEIVSSSLW